MFSSPAQKAGDPNLATELTLSTHPPEMEIPRSIDHNPKARRDIIVRRALTIPKYSANHAFLYFNAI